jgi:hypothetical protein
MTALPAAPTQPWRSALHGFLFGLLAGALPAVYATTVLRSALPLGATVVRGQATFVVAALLTTCTALATAVCFAARATTTA